MAAGGLPARRYAFPIAFALLLASSAVARASYRPILTAPDTPQAYTPLLTRLSAGESQTMASLMSRHVAGSGGQILLPVVLRRTTIADVRLRDEQGRYTVAAGDLKPWITEALSENAQKRFDELTATTGRLALEDAPAAGFALTYDESEAVLRLDPAPSALAMRDVSLRYDGLAEGQAPVSPAALSAFLNMRAGEDYVHRGKAAAGRQPLRLDSDGAVRIADLVFEGRADYVEDSDNADWQRGDMRLIRDWPEAMVRLALGDLSYPVSGFQAFQPVLGISLARNFMLQPYRVTAPTGQTSFVLQSPSRVDILVNGQRVRTLQLDPGPYDLSDFPVADGSNDVHLIITDATGRVEEKTFALLSDQNLLQEGLHEYAYNIGVESVTDDRRRHYEEQDPVFSGFHRYGFSDVLTAGLALQADTDVQQAGLSLLRTQDWGTLGWESAFSDGAGADPDLASDLSYSYQSTAGRRHFTASLRYRGRDFLALGQDTPSNPLAWESALRYNQTVAQDVNLGLGGRYGLGRDDSPDEWSWSASLSKMLSGELSMNLDWTHRRTEGAGVFAGLTWVPAQRNHTVSASIDTLTDTQTADWNWRDGRRWQLGAGVARDDGEVRGTGTAAFAGERLEASLRHDLNHVQESSGGILTSGARTEQRTQMRAGAALAFADGHIAVSRPINEGFIMLARDENLADHVIGINPAAGGIDDDPEDAVDYEVTIDSLGPAVIPDAVPYMYRSVKVDTHDLPPGYDVGQDNFAGFPSYKSGTVVKIGNAANIYADGYVMTAARTPIALQAGMIENTGDPGFPAQEFFTNKDGRFRISRLQPGAYRLIFHKFPDRPLALAVPEGQAVGRYDAGTLVLTEEGAS